MITKDSSGYNSHVSVASDEVWGIIKKKYADELSDVGNCIRFRKRMGLVTMLLRKAFLDSSLGLFNGDIYFFAGMIYETMSYDAFRDMVYELTMVRMDLPAEDIGVMKVFINTSISAVRSKELKVDNSVIVFRNGVLDVETRKLNKFDKKYVQISMVDYDYLPGATTFLWYQFLNQVIPDENYQNVLQMFLGAVFVDRKKAKIETMLVLLGSGANGKSVIQSAVKDVLGDDNVSEIGIAALCSAGTRGDQNVAIVNGKRLNYCSEIQAAEFGKDSDRLKAIISGEGVFARFLYSNGFKANNIPLLMANANKLPMFKDRTKGMLRRIYVIPMTVEIPEIRQDKTLPQKLKDERSGILNWMLDGRDKFIANDYKLPECIDVSILISNSEAKYVNPIRFMNYLGYKPNIENVDMAPQNWIRAKVLFDRYLRWCEQNGIPETMTIRKFSSTLDAAGYVKKRTSGGMSYAVFGDITTKTLRGERYDMNRRVRNLAPKSDIITIDGVMWVQNMKALAAVCGLGIGVVTRITREGKLNGCRVRDKEKYLYDINKCIDVFRAEGVIATDEEKEAKKKELKDKKYMRYCFNQRMEYWNLPYRKYKTDEPQISGCIVVPDDMPDDDVFEMAHRDLGFDLKNIVRSKGAYSRGGRGFLPKEEKEEETYNMEETENGEEQEIG